MHKRSYCWPTPIRVELMLTPVVLLYLTYPFIYIHRLYGADA